MERLLVENPADEELDLIKLKVKNYNREQTGYKSYSTYMLKYDNSNGQLIGGIIFDIRGEWMDIDFLFIEEAERKHGIGSMLLEDAELFAKAKGCKKVFLNTFSFQARPFYQKHGYHVVYVQEYEPGKTCRYYMEKKFLTGKGRCGSSTT
jgi:GNAT superfamily N-acetyltransferase